jgi:tRNA(fMet)-specific endonuclease VapC
VIHLDTNVVIALLNGRPAIVRQRFDKARQLGQRFAISTVVLHELMFGAAASERQQDNERRIALLLASGPLDIIAFDSAAAEAAGRVRALLRRRGEPIGPFDALIAGQALASQAALVTANRAEFARVDGLSVIDWSEGPSATDD